MIQDTRGTPKSLEAAINQARQEFAIALEYGGNHKTLSEFMNEAVKDFIAQKFQGRMDSPEYLEMIQLYQSIIGAK